ncbi:MAG: IS5 family transposase [Desulfosporosinus sp.]
MYKSNEKQTIIPDDFFIPFGGKLNKENRWVKLASIIPWWDFEDKYRSNFKPSHTGEQAFSVRVALGTLIIKTKLGVSDEETVNQIAENPYLQYFLGYPRFREGQPFASSLITHFRKRFNADILNEVNERIALVAKSDKKDDEGNFLSSGGGSGVQDEEGPNCRKSGKMILDATCTPADIQYPTDTRLLNDAREKLEEIIDVLHKPEQGKRKKSRTYRQKAHESYLAFTKQRKPKPEAIRKMRGKLLRYVRRDMKIIETLAERNGLELLSRQQYKNLLVIQELYRQQLEMYEYRQYRKEDRIVSISQPHVRPIVRGKASASVEFGAKLSVSVVDGFVFCEKLEWDAYNEGNTLIDSLERYKEKNGFYPEAVLADKIYRTKGNRDYCKTRGIRLSGPKLGRSSEDEKKEAKKLAYQDSRERNEVEGKFGTGKRKFTMDCIMAKLKETGESAIILNLLVLNLEKRLRLLLYDFLRRFYLSKNLDKV